VVVGCHGEDLLGMLLTHHKAVEELKYLWRWVRKRWLGVRCIYIAGNFDEAKFLQI
jgi:hypothetical protein